MSQLTPMSPDIVQNDALVQYRSGMIDRQRNQTIHVRTSEKGSSWTASLYNVNTDAPSKQIPLEPTQEELLGGLNTTPVLVVGLLLPHDPLKHRVSIEGPNKSLAKERERAARLVHDSEHSFLRVVVPKTKYIRPTSIKYYVACHPVDDICGLKLIRQEMVFFFDEIWQGIDTKQNIKARRTALGLACKTAAAADKRPTKRAKVSEESSSDIAQTPFNKGNIDATAFPKFEEYLSEEDACRVVKLFQAMNPLLYENLNPKLVSKVHNVLWENNLGNRVTHQGTGIFLEACQRKCKLDWDQEMILRTVTTILEDHDQIFRAGFSLKASNIIDEVAGKAFKQED